MNLNELQETSKTKLAQRALKEHYNVKIDLGKLDSKMTREMLGKVRGALKEAQTSKKLHESHQSPAYLKMIMMEQMLSNHYSDMNNGAPAIIVESEELAQAQVILGVQTIVDDLQKELEKINRLNIEQLTAVVQGISNEYGDAESKQFKETVGAALEQLEQTISSTKDTVQEAMKMLTGEVSAEIGADVGAELGGAPGAEMGAELGADIGTNDDAAADEMLEPEEEDLGPAGRELR